ncbi:MAG TPA: Hint domain-containing protein, partial [Acetobacteraceae bacterium]|nr:Hint domain-containing protein [Acetobacteraceae bacterium]
MGIKQWEFQLNDDLFPSDISLSGFDPALWRLPAASLDLTPAGAPRAVTAAAIAPTTIDAIYVPTLDAATGPRDVIDFGIASSATMYLTNTAAFTGTIQNLVGHDVLDIDAPATATAFDPATNLLTVLNGTSVVAAFTLLGVGTTLNATPDGQGGTVLTLKPIGTPAQVEDYIVQNDWQTALPAPYNTPEPHAWATPDPTIYYTFDAGATLGASNEAGFVRGMALYSAIANIGFAPADAAHPADLAITSNNAGQTDTTYAINVVGGATVAVDATISMDTTVFGWSNLYAIGTTDASGAGGYGFFTVLHELGHVIGFGHSGPYNDGGQSANFLPEQIFYTDTRQYSVMSYIDSSQSGANWMAGGIEVMPQTPMMYDIGAAQMLYGANTSELAGHDTFGFHTGFAPDSPLSVYNFVQNRLPVLTIWDAGQDNTLDLSGFSAPSTVDLAPGTFSSAAGLRDNIGIAGNTTIDTAIGGPGNDVFTLNGFGDTIDGGGGMNTAVLAGPRANYAVTRDAGTICVTDTLTGITDTLRNIDMLQFSNAAQPACFLRGTRLLTDRGEVEVERLRPGADPVLTASGRRAPVVWLGRRTLDPRRHPCPAEVLPVRVRAGAVAPGLPARDLLLSPDHALALGGGLVPVRYLLNGATIVQEPPRGRIAYYHVELDRHDVLLAEKLPAESYLDTGNRAAFANGGRVAALHPQFATAAAAALHIWAERACAPLLRDGPALA